MATSTAFQAIPLQLAPRKAAQSVFCLVASDITSLGIAVALSLGAKHLIEGVPEWTPYVQLWPFVFVFISVYALAGLYSGLALSPPQELRRVTISSSVIFLILGSATVTLRGATQYFTWTLLLAMILSVLLLPIFRGAVRHWFAHKEWWGTPAVIFGTRSAAEAVTETLLQQPELGLRPVAVVDDEEAGPFDVQGVPVMSIASLASRFPDSSEAAYAVVAAPERREAEMLEKIESQGLRFSRILIIPTLHDFCSLWVDTRNVGGMLALEVCQQAFIRERQFPKRILDLTLTIAGGLLILPLMLMVAAWVWVDSPGPVFYSQHRVGQDGKEFDAWKFRTMVPNADQILKQHLEENPRARAEWAKDHKLRNDPRITRAGHFLRRTSLDELPQLWNVLRGDMSLVGPRPIVKAEIEKYGNCYGLYTKVKSGLTGLWQISGRNDTTYIERVKLDTFYVRNWSVWLDFYILFRTIDTVLFRKGAY